MSEQYGLPEDFNIDGYENWLPCHNHCNQSKSSKLPAFVPGNKAILDRLAVAAPKAARVADSVVSNVAKDKVFKVYSRRSNNGHYPLWTCMNYSVHLPIPLPNPGCPAIPLFSTTATGFLATKSCGKVYVNASAANVSTNMRKYIAISSNPSLRGLSRPVCFGVVTINPSVARVACRSTSAATLVDKGYVEGLIRTNQIKSTEHVQTVVRCHAQGLETRAWRSTS